MTENLDLNKNFKVKIDIREDHIGERKEVVVNGHTREVLIQNFTKWQGTNNYWEIAAAPRIVLDPEAIEIDHNKIDRIVREIFNCVICQELFKQPYNLKVCLHKFCKKCFEDNFRIDKGKKECPVCRVPVNTQRLLREDKGMNKIIETFIPNQNKYRDRIEEFYLKSISEISKAKTEQKLNPPVINQVKTNSSSTTNNLSSSNFSSANNIQNVSSPANNFSNLKIDSTLKTDLPDVSNIKNSNITSPKRSSQSISNISSNIQVASNLDNQKISSSVSPKIKFEVKKEPNFYENKSSKNKKDMDSEETDSMDSINYEEESEDREEKQDRVNLSYKKKQERTERTGNYLPGHKFINKKIKRLTDPDSNGLHSQFKKMRTDKKIQEYFITQDELQNIITTKNNLVGVQLCCEKSDGWELFNNMKLYISDEMTIEDFSLYVLNKRQINFKLMDRLVFYTKDIYNSCQNLTREMTLKQARIFNSPSNSDNIHIYFYIR